METRLEWYVNDVKLGQTHESTDDVKLARKEEFQSGDVCKKLLGDDDGNELLGNRSNPNGKELEMALGIML